MSSHTILLVQPTRKPEGRTYSDYESVNDCMEGVCKIYEEHLKRLNPSSPQITYDISQLFDFIDELADLSCLVYQKNSQTYLPYNKDWVKEKIYILLRNQAGKNWTNVAQHSVCDNNHPKTPCRAYGRGHLKLPDTIKSTILQNYRISRSLQTQT